MRTLTALMLFAFATPAMAFTGNDYLENKDSDIQWVQGFTEGFVLGIVRHYRNFGAMGYCANFPDNAEAKQNIRIVEKFLEEHPEKTHYEIEYLVVLAFQSAFGTRSVNERGSCS